MSLPPAPKDISAKPAKGSVVEPVDKEKKDKDVAQKLKLYNTIQAFRASRLPSNAQVDSFLTYVQKNVDSVKSSDQHVSKDTRELFTDFNAILDAIRDEIHQKNGDELIQDFVWRTRVQDISDEVAEGIKSTSTKEAPVTKDKAKEDADTALLNLRTLMKLLTTNSEARKLVTDLSVIGRDLVSRGAAKAAGAIAPSPEELARVDDSTKRDEFVESDDQPTTIEAKTAAAEVTAGAKDTTAETTKIAAAETQAAAADTTTSSEEEVEGEKKKGLFSRLSGRIPEKHKTTAKEHFHKGRKFLMEDYFPKDRRDQWIWRAKKVVIECQSHPEYQSSLKWLLDFVEEYFGHGKTLAQTHGGNVAETLGGKDTELNKTIQTVLTVADRFANNKSFNDLVLVRLQTISQDARDDQELRAWWSRVGKYLRRLLLEPGYIVEPKSETDGRKLLDDGKKFYGTGSRESTPAPEPTPAVTDPATVAGTPAAVPAVAAGATSASTDASQQRGKYKQHLDTLFDGLGDWVKGISEEEGNRKLGNALTKFTKDLLFVDVNDGEGGKLSLKREMWGDIRRVVLPALVEKVGYIPIPRVEYTDDGLDLVVENLTLSGKNLFPNIVAVEAHNYLKFSPYGIGKEEGSRHEMIITLSQMQADMRDVAFYFERKSGIRIKDSGLADVVIGGEGVNVTIHVVSSGNDPSSFFQVKNINVKIDTLKFSIRDSKHDLLYKTLRPLATGLIKRQISKAIKDGISTGLGIVDGQLIAVRDRIQETRASQSQEGTPEGKKLSVFDAFKRTRSKDATETSSSLERSGSQFKVVSNKRNSILANKGHPAGWVNRANDKSDFKETKEGQEGWKSDAFDIQSPPAQTVSATA